MPSARKASRSSGEWPGFESVGAHGGHRELPFAEQCFILFPPDLLHEAQAGAVQFKHLRGHPQFVVQPRRRVVTRFAGVNYEQQVLAGKLGLGKPQVPQPLGTRPLHEFQIVDVIHHATGVGVLVIDATAVSERFQAILRAHTLVLTPQLANPPRQLFCMDNVLLPVRQARASGRTTKTMIRSVIHRDRRTLRLRRSALECSGQNASRHAE